MAMKIKSAEKCRFDIVALGEVMLRLDPGEGRIHTTRQFRVWEGGGEYNVARGLRRCFGMRAALVTAFADNPRRAACRRPYSSGRHRYVVRQVDCVRRRRALGAERSKFYGARIRRARSGRLLGPRPHGGVAIESRRRGLGRSFRRGRPLVSHGRNFRRALRNHSRRRRRSHEGAKKHGAIISYDLNYRASLWKSIGGKTRAREVNRELAPYVDVMFATKKISRPVSATK